MLAMAVAMAVVGEHESVVTRRWERVPGHGGRARARGKLRCGPVLLLESARDWRELLLATQRLVLELRLRCRKLVETQVVWRVHLRPLERL